MTDHDRRTFLRSIGAASLGVLAAGCSGDGGESTDEPTDTATATPTETPTATATDSPTPTATETTADSGTPTETATVTPGEADYTDGPRTTALHDPRDGFADIAHWVEDEWQDVTVRRVTEPTRRALEGALIYDEPTVVVFETSGTIDLENRALTISTDKTWIAGQTAPSPGVTITGGSLWIEANDIVVQHLRVKPGDGADYAPDSMDSIFTQDGTQNNVIDHCTATWSTDECLSVGYDTNNTTVTNCLVAEPLHDSLHSKGAHGYGSLTGNNAKNVFYAGNVWAQSYARNPRLKTGVEATVVNNVMYHYDRGVRLDADSESAVVGNAFIEPVDTSKAHIQGGIVHAADNVSEPENVPMTSNLENEVDQPPLWPEDLEAVSGADVESHNLTHAGARPVERTEHDQAIVQKVRERSADGWIDSQEEVGGYPELEENTRELDVPADTRGELRAWLREHARQVEPEQ